MVTRSETSPDRARILTRRTRCTRRTSERGVSPVEVAVGIAIFGSLFAVAIPAFVKELHASRFAEPIDGLAAIANGASQYARDRAIPDAFPPSAPLTPPTVPRGKREPDPVGAWDTPTWKALGFRAVDEGVAHAFSFGFDSEPGPSESRFVAHAHADFDGDTVTSTFEIRGVTESSGGQGGQVIGVKIEPGMFVQSELE
ncbi:type II secretion system protein [Pendulispora albinea]|uniref:Type II secretion system protein n=1 Tax=Pendulispora albinea TaxID=2741071 RepID=A0ABZ2M9A7_9BACT